MLEYSNVCRICLKEEDPKLPIFTEDEGKFKGDKSKLTLPEKIMSFAKVQVTKDDGLSKLICVKCYCQVDVALEFKRLCEESFRFATQQLDQKETGNSNPDSKNHDLSTKPNPRPHASSSTASTRNNAENQPEEQSSLQIFSTSGNVQAWSEENERISDQIEIDLSIVKTECNWEEIPTEFESPKMNGYDHHSYEDYGETSQTVQEEFIKPEEPVVSVKKTVKCHNCEMTFGSRRDVATHIIAVHRTCAICGVYFMTNKQKETHICSEIPNEKKAPVVSNGKVGQFCRLCKKTVKHMKLHRTSLLHKKSKEKYQEMQKESDPLETKPEIKATVMIKMEPPPEPETQLEEEQEPGTEPEPEVGNADRLQCQLCYLYCQNQRGLRTHMIRMHREHRIVFNCNVCTLQFSSKSACARHMFENHKDASAENLRFEFVHVGKNESEEEAETPLVKRKRTIVVNKFECTICSAKYLSFEKCLEHLYLVHKSSNAQRIRILRESSDFIETEKDSQQEPPVLKQEENPPKMKKTHPEFVRRTPIITHNFDTVFDSDGQKKFKCHGCKFVYRSYISAYNHYYILSKKHAKMAQKQVPIENKKFNCNSCTLKFTSRSQVMTHRMQAHKYYHKQMKATRKNEALKER